MNVPIETPEINDISLLLLAQLNTAGDAKVTASRLQVLAGSASAPTALMPLLNQGLIQREARQTSGFVYSITAKGQVLARSLIAALKNATA